MDQRQDLHKILHSVQESLSTLNPIFGTNRTVRLAWRRYAPFSFSFANERAYASVQAGVDKIAINGNVVADACAQRAIRTPRHVDELRCCRRLALQLRPQLQHRQLLGFGLDPPR